jgi:hypothetical protein
MNIVKVNAQVPALNVRQLFNPLFYSIDCRHPDMKRQRSRRLRSITLDGCRALKAQHAGSSWMPRLLDLTSPELFPTAMPQLYAAMNAARWRAR